MTTDRTIGVIFDLDGVLVDSAESHFKSWKLLAEEYGGSVTRKQFSQTFGRQNRDIIPILFGDASEESRKILRKGLYEYVEEQVGELRKKNPEIQIKLVLKNEAGQVFGGLQGYTTLKVVHIERLWVHEQYRGQGYGKQLLLTAEQMARANGCISGLATVLSFHAPKFFQNQGYELFGVSDGYPDPIKDYYFIKHFET